MLKRPIFVVIFFTLFTGGCVGPKPLKDYVLSHQAMVYAKRSEADVIANSWFSKAEDTYQQAEIAWANSEHDRAKKLFIKARRYFERAENMAKVQKFKTGDGP